MNWIALTNMRIELYKLNSDKRVINGIEDLLHELISIDKRLIGA